MLRNRTEFCFLIVLAALVMLAAGCGTKPAQDTKTPDLPQVGIVDTQTVIKNHPKFGDLQRLRQEYAVLAAQVQAAGGQAGTNLPESLPAGMNEAAEREFGAKMAAKEKELKTELGSAEEQERQSAQTALDAYVGELDKVYQPQIFSIQLKLKTVQLSKEEGAALQADLERIQGERSAKIAARQQELAKKMDQTMTAKQADAERRLDAYKQQLNVAIAGDLTAKQAELAGQAAAAQPDRGGQSDLEQQLAMKQQEIKSLQDFISSDIRDKSGKLAAEKGLGAVLADVGVNVSAVDLTAAVIAEFKK
ncbi:MAG: molecular chaperone Skp [Negativicutes bacterium]|nr:molecular chaperone Skp [Negativicutes bacterium]